ncbi:MAG TPA: hypothetical protein PKI62_00655 [bacterium]|nr:hypothetical protein [bacterium]HPR86868.1 hypothetical protein [bacterium]
MKVLLQAGLLLVLLAAVPVLAEKGDKEKSRNADVVAPDAAVHAAYECISGAAGRERDWPRMRHLWLDGARIILSSQEYAGKRRWENLDLETFIKRVSVYYRQEGIFEREIAATVHRFGNVAQVWSTFEVCKGAPDGPVIGRGINAWQLVETEGRWLIAQLIYDFESDRNPLPQRYLQ